MLKKLFSKIHPLIGLKKIFLFFVKIFGKIINYLSQQIRKQVHNFKRVLNFLWNIRKKKIENDTFTDDETRTFYDHFNSRFVTIIPTNDTSNDNNIIQQNIIQYTDIGFNSGMTYWNTNAIIRDVVSCSATVWGTSGPRWQHNSGRIYPPLYDSKNEFENKIEDKLEDNEPDNSEIKWWKDGKLISDDSF